MKYLLSIALLLVACSTSPDTGTVRQLACGDAGSAGQGGAAGMDAGSGGSPASGGSPGAGGASAGGMVGSGGAATGGAPGAGGAATGGSPGSGGSPPVPYIRQAAEFHVVYPPSQDVSVSLPMPVLGGSAIVVFATEFLPEATARPITVSGAGGSYALIDTIVDPDDRSLMAVKDFVRLNAPAGSLTVTAHYQYDTDWDAVVAAEVVGVSSQLAHAVRLQNLPNKNANSATSNPMTFGSAPALVVGFSVSGRALFGPPLAGTGFTSNGSFINWGGAEGTANKPSATLESQLVMAPGTIAATFTPGSPPNPSSASPERLMTFGLVLQ